MIHMTDLITKKILPSQDEPEYEKEDKSVDF